MVKLNDIEFQESLQHLVGKGDEDSKTIAYIVNDLYLQAKQVEALGEDERKQALSAISQQIVEGFGELTTLVKLLAGYGKAMSYYADLLSIHTKDTTPEASYKAKLLVDSYYDVLVKSGLEIEGSRNLQYLLINESIKEQEESEVK